MGGEILTMPIFVSTVVEKLFLGLINAPFVNRGDWYTKTKGSSVRNTGGFITRSSLDSNCPDYDDPTLFDGLIWIKTRNW